VSGGRISRPARSAAVSVRLLAAGLFAATGGPAGPPDGRPLPVTEYRGLCDASAAVFLDDSHFVVANDEDNTLRVYRIQEPNPVRSVRMDDFLKPDSRLRNREADIEAATRMDDLVFWITSHGRDKDGNWRSNRQRFFAVRTDSLHPGLLVPAGSPYKRLVRDLLADPGLSGLGLDKAASPDVPRKKSLSPKKKGLNIEGLCRIPGTRSFWIGFRNPVPAGKALLVPLLNPEEAVFQGSRCSFGKPVLLDLGGLSIRDMAPDPEGAVWIVAGRADGAPEYRIYEWSGRPSDSPTQRRIATDLFAAESFTPEALVPAPGGRDWLILSDDGNRSMRDPDGSACPCKRLQRPGDRRFRGAWFPLIESESGDLP
jgi:hypothetical protein